MADIHIHRHHALGLVKARKIAWAWAEQVETEFAMVCTVVEGDEGDTVEFQRSGVSGTLAVTATDFEMHAKLGFLLGAFSHKIEAEITKNLDQLLSKTPAVPVKKTSAKKTAAKR